MEASRTGSWKVALCAMAATALVGCAELLPKARNTFESPWPDFEHARAALERIEPYRTTRADLKAADIDPYTNANITLITYSDIILRFPIGGSVPPAIATDSLKCAAGVRFAFRQCHCRCLSPADPTCARPVQRRLGGPVDPML